MDTQREVGGDRPIYRSEWVIHSVKQDNFLLTGWSAEEQRKEGDKDWHGRKKSGPLQTQMSTALCGETIKAMVCMSVCLGSIFCTSMSPFPLEQSLKGTNRLHNPLMLPRLGCQDNGDMACSAPLPLFSFSRASQPWLAR